MLRGLLDYNETKEESTIETKAKTNTNTSNQNTTTDNKITIITDEIIQKGLKIVTQVNSILNLEIYFIQMGISGKDKEKLNYLYKVSNDINLLLKVFEEAKDELKGELAFEYIIKRYFYLLKEDFKKIGLEINDFEEEIKFLKILTK